MRFTRLRITGFKSFVEPIEFRIEPGLTGVVGPNGCGKSNVMEALRWVMGASSAKAMRAEGMDDVIFAGSATRPARNHAEVQLTIDNSDRKAPAAFNDDDTLEVSRRITRGQGSVYRVNGREARARDVQRLFADAGSGANSPALVRQGQISELIAAKPENRRRVLEEAAGVAGLRSRKHEAELKLNAAAANLAKLEDVLAGAERELEGLRRQARQAKRYVKIAAEARALQAAVAARRVADARARAQAAEQALADANAAVERTTREVAAANARALEASEATPAVRDAEAKAAAALAHVSNVLDQATRELDQTRQEIERAQADKAHAEDERARESALTADADAALKRLAEETSSLVAADENANTDELQRARVGADTALAAAQAERDALTAAAAAFEAQARALDARIGRGRQAVPRLESEIAKLDATGAAAAPAPQDLEAAKAAVAQAEAALAAARDEAAKAAEAADAAIVAERQAAEAFAAADRAAAAAEAEAQALERALAAEVAGPSPAADALTVAPGWERALGAALGDDLLASLDAAVAAHWAGAATPDQPLPDGAAPLSVHVEAPAALAARLSQVGVVAAADGDRLAALLKPGQRLVAQDGALWRWDGFRVAAGAASAAERRLAARTARDAALARRGDAVETREIAREKRAAAQAASREAVAQRDALRARPRVAETELRAHQARLAELERAAARADAAATAAAQARARLASQLDEERAALVEADAERAALAAPDADMLKAASVSLEAARSAAATARAAQESAERAAAERRARRSAIATEVEAWRARSASARERLEALAQRATELEARIAALKDKPDALTVRIEKLREEKAKAEAARSQAGDAVAQAETHGSSSDKALKVAEQELSAAREARAGAEVRLTAMQERLVEAEAELRAAPVVRPEDAFTEELPLEQIEARLQGKLAERDKIGPVNLQAHEEAEARDASLAATRAERDDLTEAVNKLRAGVRAIDAEARERLRAAFTVIDGHFRDLFQALFNGGEARLALVDDEDPLVAGLDIHVSPPGKRLGSMSLMSGGEQALTATALIFAVFLANPAPICCLDEVDAPLDDANVGRYCDLLDAMRKKSDTRFVIITHNPVTMSRVDRLYGVTMAERGCSQLVSVDLARAEALAAAS